MTETRDAHAPTPAEIEAYHELLGYTLAHGDPAFVHQHAVDTWTAQHADGRTKPIALTFALIGLYLHVERGLSGREVQRIHMRLARRPHPWPVFPRPRDRGSLTVREVMAAAPGPDRDRAIDDWCATVWAAYSGGRDEVIALLARHGID